jgi:asparagine synthase (glutamine-hydrolysing)
MAVRNSVELLRRLGPAWAFFRARYALKAKTGFLKRRFPTVGHDVATLADFIASGTPICTDEVKRLHEDRGGRFFFVRGQLPDRIRLNDIVCPDGLRRTIETADDYCRGRFLCFNDRTFDLGWPPDWLLNPFNGAHHEAGTHWCDYPTFSPALGDIKEVWEPSRFACAYWLARAYALAGEEKYATAFWVLFDTWAAQNPPNRGPHWKCGQETAVRLFAWCFALHVLWSAPVTTDARVASMLRLMAIQADRIFHNIDFAISQRNNHSMSEAVGLLTVGLLFPYLKRAAAWQARGRDVLERDARRLIYDDGSFVQHSLNYHRVMLHVCLWAMRLCELNDQPLSNELRRRVKLSAEFLFELTDHASGGAPNYGANDGALVLPLAACDYSDFRPTLQAAYLASCARRVFEAGPWDEMPFWLYGAESLAAPIENRTPTSRRFDSGGYYTIRGKNSWAMIRCHTYRDRPAHVDMLHLDLWYKGVNILSDSGSYQYYTPEAPRLDKYFKDIAAHNTIEVDGRGPLDLVSRFLWLPWPDARCLDFGPDRFQGEHDAYNRAPWNVIHRRTVELEPDGAWIITDDLLGTGQHEVALRWHFCKGKLRLRSEGAVEVEMPDGWIITQVVGPAGMELDLQEGYEGPDGFAGWESRYYAQRTARPVLKAHGIFDLPARLITHIRFADAWSS